MGFLAELFNVDTICKIMLHILRGWKHCQYSVKYGKFLYLYSLIERFLVTESGHFRCLSIGFMMSAYVLYSIC